MADAGLTFKNGHPFGDSPTDVYRKDGYNRCRRCRNEDAKRLRSKHRMEKEKAIEEAFYGLRSMLREGGHAEHFNIFVGFLELLKKLNVDLEEARSYTRRVVDLGMGGIGRPSKNADKDKWQLKLDLTTRDWEDAVAHCFGKKFEAPVVHRERPQQSSSGNSKGELLTPMGTNVWDLVDIVRCRIENPFRDHRLDHKDGTPYSDEEHVAYVERMIRSSVKVIWPYLPADIKAEFARFTP